MRTIVQRAWLRCAAGVALIIGLFAVYLLLRPVLVDSPPGTAELLSLVAACVVTVALMTFWYARRLYRDALGRLSDHVAALRANPSPSLLHSS